MFDDGSWGHAFDVDEIIEGVKCGDDCALDNGCAAGVDVVELID